MTRLKLRPDSKTNESPNHVLYEVLEQLGSLLQAQFILLSQLRGEVLTFPFAWGVLPPEVETFIARGSVAVAAHPLAAMLVESGSAYYSEKPYNAEGESVLKHFALAVAAEPIKDVNHRLVGFINVGREPKVGVWTKDERESLRRAAAGLELIGEKVSTRPTDVDIRKRAEEALRESEARFRTLADSSPLVIWVTDALGEVEFVNRAYTLFFGVSEVQVKNKGWRPLVFEEDSESYARAFFNALHEQKPFHAEARVRHADGSWRWIESFGVPRFSPSGTFLGISGNSLDITERKRSEEQLRRNHETFFNLVQNAPFGIYVVDSAFRLVQISAGSKKVFSTVNPLLGRDFAEVLRTLWPEPFASEAIHHFRHTLETGESYHAPNISERRADLGDTEAYDWRLERVVLPDGRFGVVCYFYDLTERQEAEKKLRQSEARFRRILRQSHAGILETDASGRMTLVNGRWCEMIGYSEDELLTMSVLDVTHPSSLEATKEAVARLAAGGADFQIEKNYRRKDGSTMVANSSVSALRSEEGEFLGLVAVVLDITERKKAEEALQEADKRKDEFLATLGHELRNPLAPIRMGVELMKRSDDPALLREARDIIARQSEQLQHLLDDLLDVSRISRGSITLQKETLELSSVVKTAVESCRPLLEDKKHDLVLTLPFKPLYLEADKTRLTQIILNLLTNAAKYTSPGGKITLSAKQEGAEVVISVADNGIGIPQPMLAQVFNMFTRLERKESYQQQGLGIGLSLVKQLVELHGGSVTAFSSGEGQGSTFTLRLPVAHPPSRSKEVTASSATHTARRVLVVDDNLANLKTLSRMLKLMGHEVVTAESGERALGELASFSPEVVLLDINMPGLNGYEVARRLRENPAFESVKLVALTGYGQARDVQRTKEAGFDLHLVKPVDTERLEAVLA